MKKRILTFVLKTFFKEEFLRQKLSKKELEILLKHQLDKSGDINLTNLNLKGFDVYLDDLKADYINNSFQEAKSIDNIFQKADNIYNKGQQADNIINAEQEAKSIDNKNQKQKK